MLRLLKNFINFMFSRLFLVALMLVAQVALLLTLLMYFSESVFYVYLSMNLLSFVAVIAIVSNRENPSFKLTWIIAILVFPLTGGMFYLLFGNKRMPRKLERRLGDVLGETKAHMPEFNEDAFLTDPERLVQSRFIYGYSGSPVFTGTSSEYFPTGEQMFASMLSELEQAEKFIFLEYFIIRPGSMWDSIFEILKRKAAAGVEVRLIYDDIGCIKSMPKGYDKIIRAAGIDLCVFNPFKPRVSVILNHRDHRKVTVIDNKCAFCGGVNLADEYINRLERFGHWKDTGVMLKGEAVWSFTFLFLQMWHFEQASGEAEPIPPDYAKYRAACGEYHDDGLVQPFGDSPMDRFNVTETAYLNIIHRAKDYVYITTPYLVIDNEMERALCSAAQAGVDVRIITPYIYDKWYVHLLTRSHYGQLIRAGVKVCEYLPGFIHSKMFVSDDDTCMVGTCNMDFRSFHLHFECSVAFYGSHVVQKVKEDILACQSLSREITLEETDGTPIWQRLLRAFLKLFAPLM